MKDLKIIGDKVYFNGFKVANLENESTTATADFVEWLEYVLSDYE